MSNIFRRHIDSLFHGDSPNLGRPNKSPFTTYQSSANKVLQMSQFMFSRKVQRIVTYICVMLALLGIILLSERLSKELGRSGLPQPECHVEYYLGARCSYVADRIASQLISWDEQKTCGRGVRCNYRLLRQDGEMIEGIHLSANRWHEKNLTFWFREEKYDRNACQMFVHSKTTNYYFSVEDRGSNYCGIHNLVKGAKLLDGHISSDESSSEAECVNYIEANCENQDM